MLDGDMAKTTQVFDVPSTKTEAGAASARPRVDYYYDECIGNFVYGATHPMRPHRVRLTHHLLVSYGLYKHMNVFRPKKAKAEDMTAFHSDDYISFLQEVNPDNMHDFYQHFERFGVGDDCPIFEGLFEYCQVSGLRARAPPGPGQ